MYPFYPLLNRKLIYHNNKMQYIFNAFFWLFIEGRKFSFWNFWNLDWVRLSNSSCRSICRLAPNGWVSATRDIWRRECKVLTLHNCRQQGYVPVMPIHGSLVALPLADIYGCIGTFQVARIGRAYGLQIIWSTSRLYSSSFPPPM